MTAQDFFDNCHVFFEDIEDEDAKFIDIKASLYKNKDGEINELRFFNPQYDEFLVVDNTGKVSFINIEEEQYNKLQK